VDVFSVGGSTVSSERPGLRHHHAGSPELWIVDLVHRRVEVHAEPHDLGYASSVIVGRDAAIAPRAFPDDAIAVAAFLP
jgi:Uma2 family endonuclease